MPEVQPEEPGPAVEDDEASSHLLSSDDGILYMSEDEKEDAATAISGATWCHACRWILVVGHHNLLQEIAPVDDALVMLANGNIKLRHERIQNYVCGTGLKRARDPGDEDAEEQGLRAGDAQLSNGTVGNSPKRRKTSI